MPGIEFKHAELTKNIIGLAMKVHRYFGAGFQESVYQKALMIELDMAGIKYEQEKEFSIYYQGKLIKKRRLDLLIEDLVILELKATQQTTHGNVNQVLNYMRIFEKEIGLFFNFGGKSLYFKRYIYNPVQQSPE